MLPHDLLVLRAATYDAQHTFNRAFAAYETAYMTHDPALLDVAHTCRAASERYATSLTALLDYLDQDAADPSRRAEHKRTQRLQDTLQREIAMLPEPA